MRTVTFDRILDEIANVGQNFEVMSFGLDCEIKILARCTGRVMRRENLKRTFVIAVCFLR